MNGGLPVEVTFIDGSKFFLQYFGDCVFQINYKERPFSIYNENLEMMLIKNGAN